MHTANSIPLKPVASTALAAIGHDTATETLAVQMFQGSKPGNVYHYANVTLAEYSAMASAKSLGEHLARHIKAHKVKHPCTNMGMPVIELAPVKLSKELLTGLLTGREYGKEMRKEEEMQAKAAGLIVIFGASDDLMEFRGFVDDEIGAPTDALIDAKGLLPNRDSIDDDASLKDFFAREPLARTVEALWCAEDGYSWTYRTTVPHATFEIVEGGEPYCRGIVIDVADLGAAP